MTLSRNPIKHESVKAFLTIIHVFTFSPCFSDYFSWLGALQLVNPMEMILLVFFMFISTRGMVEKEDGTSQTARAREKWNSHLPSLIDNFFKKMFYFYFLILDVWTLAKCLISSCVNFTLILVYISLLALIA